MEYLRLKEVIEVLGPETCCSEREIGQQDGWRQGGMKEMESGSTIRERQSDRERGGRETD